MVAGKCVRGRGSCGLSDMFILLPTVRFILSFMYSLILIFFVNGLSHYGSGFIVVAHALRRIPSKTMFYFFIFF